MVEHVEAVDLGVEWDPNAPEALLLSDGSGKTLLALKPHHDDPDQSCVVLAWSGAHSACMADPNDEAISGHRLYGSGLSEVLSAGVVRDSDTIRALTKQNSVHAYHDPSRFDGLTHHIVLLKECVVEVVAGSLSIVRFDGTTLDATVAALRI
jgi:hypothetical protein